MKHEKFEDLLRRVNKEEFIDYYRSHNNHDTYIYFQTTSSRVTELAKYYGFIKSKEDIKNTSKNTFLEKYGVDNPSKNAEVLNKIKIQRDTNKVSKS